MRNPLKKYVLCHLTYGLADPVDLRWGQPRYVTLKDLKRQKELGALVSSIDSTCGGRMWTLRLDTTGTYPSNEDSRTGMGVAITPAYIVMGVVPGVVADVVPDVPTCVICCSDITTQHACQLCENVSCMTCFAVVVAECCERKHHASVAHAPARAAAQRCVRLPCAIHSTGARTLL